MISNTEQDECSTYEVRVYYEDTDAGGVVYHSQYLNFLERARTEWLRQYGFEQDEMVQNLNVIFAVRSVSIEYIRGGRFNDLLQVCSKIIECKKSNFTFYHEIYRKNKNKPSELLITATVKIAAVNIKISRATRIPTELMEVIASEH